MYNAHIYMLMLNMYMHTNAQVLEETGIRVVFEGIIAFREQHKAGVEVSSYMVVCVCVSVYLCVPVCLSVCVFLSVCLSVCMSVCLSVLLPGESTEVKVSPY
jgi:hypothetical protein